MAVRESINRIKIEGWRVSRVPVNPDEDIYQGDLMVWDTVNRRATRGLVAASGATFLGMSDTKNQVETAGSPSLLSSTKLNRINIVQDGLVEVVWGASETVYPFDTVALAGSDAQTCVKSGSNVIGVVDPSYGSAGKAVTAGDLVRIWLRVPSTYKLF